MLGLYDAGISVEQLRQDRFSALCGVISYFKITSRLALLRSIERMEARTNERSTAQPRQRGSVEQPAIKKKCLPSDGADGKHFFWLIATNMKCNAHLRFGKPFGR